MAKKQSTQVVISASRRTDIPAFYAQWFMNRIRAGFCNVPNPVNPKTVSRVSLAPEDVLVIVFWTRNPKPLMSHLHELDQRGYKYYFNYTVMKNPRSIDPKSPPLDAAIKTFQELSEQIGPDRVIWRYDPIVLSNKTDVAFHLEAYQEIALRIGDATSRSVISIVDSYRKIAERMKALETEGIFVQKPDLNADDFRHLMEGIRDIAASQGYHLQSCAEELDLTQFGVFPGKCIDEKLINELFQLELKNQKDKGQREACQCIPSRDIGAYDTCTFGCAYCYATTSFDKARENLKAHNPESPSLVGWLETEDSLSIPQNASLEQKRLL